MAGLMAGREVGCFIGKLIGRSFLCFALCVAAHDALR